MSQEIDGVSSLQMNQVKQQIMNRICHHSKAVTELGGDFGNIWDLPPLANEEFFCVFLNRDIQHQILRSDKLLNKGKYSILYTVNSKRERIATCDKCTRRPCPCFNAFLKLTDPPEVGNDGNENTDHENDLTWERERNRRAPSDHYDVNLTLDQYYEEHGGNRTAIIYPPKHDIEKHDLWVRRIQKDEYILQEIMLPAYDDSLECKHHNKFFPSDEVSKLHQVSFNILICSDTSEKTANVKVYCRPTVGGNGRRSPCQCYQQADGDQWLLWHIKKGTFVCYKSLHLHMHRFRSFGFPMLAAYQSRRDALSAIDIETALTYEEYEKAVTGFFYQVSAGFTDDVFICPKCTASPPYLVFDGIDIAPSKRKIEHLHKLDAPGGEDQGLPQGGFFKDRVFLTSSDERDLVCKLLTNEVTMEEFLAEDIINTNNARGCPEFCKSCKCPKF